MSSPLAVFEPLLASSKRVLRNLTTLPDLIAAYEPLKQTSLSPFTLTDSERRLVLDLPDIDIETANISAVTSLSRGELIEKAISDRASLAQEEVILLRDRFWTPSSSEESLKILRGLGKTGEEVFEQFEYTRQLAYLPNEQEAFSIGIMEFWARDQAGFIYLYDAAAQQVDPQRLEDFSTHLGGFFRHVLQYNGSKDIIDRKWQLMPFNAPNTAFAPTETPVSNDNSDSTKNYEGGTMLRKAFQDILKDPQEYQEAGNVTAVNTNTPRHQFKDGIAASGLLTNTFLAIDPVCIDSVLATGNWYDNIRVLAFEADFPVEGRKYIEGYPGYTWVGLDQLAYYFYELRLMKAEEVGMDEIWKAAQESRNKAFVSMDPEEALSWTTSRPMSGFTRDSILGKRRYTVRDARKEREANESS